MTTEVSRARPHMTRGSLYAQSATTLAAMLARREVSCIEVVRAHLNRILDVDGRIRAFTTVFREAVLADARRADEARARGETLGPLHGLPVTVKENIDIEGHATTLGVPTRQGHRAEADAAVVRALREAGAIVLGRTNVPQLLLSFECRNPIYGVTANPWSQRHTPGGSSGGEAAALAAGMTPLGIGTDMGGSIRIPAHFSGVAGLKPSPDRWPNRGCWTAVPGQEAVRAQVGPMARSARDLALLFTALDPRRLSEFDGRVPPLPMEDPSRVDLAALRVGIYHEDGLLPPSPAIARALERAAEALRERGCEVVPFTPPSIPDAVLSCFAALSADGTATLTSAMDGHEIEPTLGSLTRLARLPRALRTAASRIASLAGEANAGRVLAALGRRSVEDFWRITREMRAYRFEIEDTMAQTRVQLLLCPPFATPAMPHTLSRDFALAASYTILWNVVPLPAGVVPVARVQTDETRREPRGDRFVRRAVEIDRESEGLPVGVQVVGRAWREAEVLAAMMAIEDHAALHPDFPRTPVPPV